MEINYDKLAELFLNSEDNISKFCNRYIEDKDSFVKYLDNLGYYPKKLRTGINTKKFKQAVDLYKEMSISPGCIAKKIGINGQSLTAELKELGVFDPEKQGKREKAYNEYIFDSIDTEEKAYWLGYIYADGYIYNAKPRDSGRIDYNFELCAKGDDMGHMQKFADFISYNTPLKKTKVITNGVEYSRCRVCLSSKHLWETLNNYGCTPRKSLTLQFPNLNIFKDTSLVRHFIRGYFDGDGYVSKTKGEYKTLTIQVLGTESFLNSVLKFLKLSSELKHNHNNLGEITMYFSINSIFALTFLYKIYNNSTIYLDRKYEKYKEHCRLYEKSYKELQTKIGEDCDVNTEISTETKESVPS
ncbi:LAGLIDADG family homing endonuclease [Intestinibacter sp.]|uniref:LAGLIDADG family homing endonuclease n=1 Tax=Intestinibacter sp. TaxID=1965304 RepID=UPI003F152092